MDKTKTQTLDALLDINLNYLRSVKDFCSWTTFSETKLQLSESFKTIQMFFKLRHLVDEKKMDEALQKDWEVLQSVAAASKQLIYDSNEDENSVTEEMSWKILLPLCKAVILESNKHTDFVCEKEGLRTAPIGLGTYNTWHGSPDCRMLPNEVNVIVKEEDEEEVEEEEVEEEEEEGAVNREFKCNMRKKHEDVRSQVVATTVVTSFTKKQYMAPVLLMCKRRVRVCLYDHKADILGFSVEVSFPMGVYLIWAILHHR